MNGSGKTAIIESVSILKNLALNNFYLSNEINQKNLFESINKQTSVFKTCIEFIVFKENEKPQIFKYGVQLKLDALNHYTINNEFLAFKKAYSKNAGYKVIYEVNDGKCIFNIGVKKQNSFFNQLILNTQNLLSNSTLIALFIENIANNKLKLNSDKDLENLFVLADIFIFFSCVFVFKQDSDNHVAHIVSKQVGLFSEKNLIRDTFKNIQLDLSFVNKEICTDNNEVDIDEFDIFEQKIKRLTKFIKVFKNNLVSIEIDKKINTDKYICDLIMVYEDYKVHSEFESTGVKKLIQLYIYFCEMVSGSIVFIDELDANLHDVYLCALLQFLKEYGKGQLTFTTHNVGPMEVLKNSKKSIDFLSVDNKVYPWIKNGNYSPSLLYKEGMIQGSPFNVDYFDFLQALTVGDDE